MFPGPYFAKPYFAQAYFPSNSSVISFKNFTAFDGMSVGDQKFAGTRSSFGWSRETDVVHVKEVNNRWRFETGKLPPR